MEEGIRILLVDDDADDHYFFIQATQRLERPRCQVTCLFNGEQALHYLLREGEYHTCRDPLPDIIVLDINMPVMNGLRLLNILKNSRKLSHIPVCVYSTSDSFVDKERCYALGCAGYFLKPDSFELVTETIRQMLSPVRREDKDTKDLS